MVDRQSPGARAHASVVTVWLSPINVKADESPPTPPQVPPERPEEPEPPCWGSAEYGSGIREPLLTPGPTEFVSGFFLDGGPLVGFSAPGCERPVPPPGGGTVEVMSASGTLVARQTSEGGHFAEVALPPGSYTVVGTFTSAIINGTPAQQTESVVIPAGYTVRQDFVLQIP